jgi:thioredoxin 1
MFTCPTLSRVLIFCGTHGGNRDTFKELEAAAAAAAAAEASSSSFASAATVTSSLIPDAAEVSAACSGKVLLLQDDDAFEAQRTLAARLGLPLVVDFTASWCGPCKRVAPVFDSLASQHPTAIYVKVDVDALPATAASFGITSMPTFKVLKPKKEGATATEPELEEAETLLGANPAELERLVSRHASLEN